MYAIVKTGGKQYKVAPGDTFNVEKLPGEVGDKVALEALCVVDGKNVEADPAKAAKTPVEAEIVEQFRDKKVLVFKFKKRKNYKKLRGHRQSLTRIRVLSVGSEKYAAPKAKKAAASKAKEADAAAKPATKKAAASSKTASTTAAKKTTAKASAAEGKKAATAAEEKKPATKKAASTAKKTTAKTPAAKKTTTAKKATTKKAAAKADDDKAADAKKDAE